MTWTPERIAELERLWTSGMPTAAIGRRLGISKNAVIGKARRLGLAARPSPIRKPAETPPQAAPSKVVGFAEHGGNPCQWPFGDPGRENFRFCGKPAVPGKPYCAEHCERAYVRSEPRREDRAA